MALADADIFQAQLRTTLSTVVDKVCFLNSLRVLQRAMDRAINFSRAVSDPCVSDFCLIVR
jgi:hypothetical protein